MKKTLQACIMLLTLSCISVSAQTVVTATYSTGFDNTAGKAGWMKYRKGDTGPNDFVYSTNAYSPATSLYHGYPVGGSVATIDWFVSPGFDFSSGGKIDSLRAAFSGFGMPAVADTVALYLLKGSADPALATSTTLLFDFRGADYANDNTWRKFTNINVAATAGQSYIGIKYKTVSNWLDVKFDNISVSASHTIIATGISNTANTNEAISLYPNPVEKYLTVSAPEKLSGELSVRLFNILGELVLEKSFIEKTQILLEQPKGVYFYQVADTGSRVIKSGKLIVQ